MNTQSIKRKKPRRPLYFRVERMVRPETGECVGALVLDLLRAGGFDNAKIAYAESFETGEQIGKREDGQITIYWQGFPHD